MLAQRWRIFVARTSNLDAIANLTDWVVDVEGRHGESVQKRCEDKLRSEVWTEGRIKKIVVDFW